MTWLFQKFVTKEDGRIKAISPKVAADSQFIKDLTQPIYGAKNASSSKHEFYEANMGLSPQTAMIKDADISQLLTSLAAANFEIALDAVDDFDF